MLDVVHALRAEQIAQEAAAAMALGSGVSVTEAVEQFDAELHHDPTAGLDPETVELRRVLGVL